jgi:hypothetical protein
VLVIAVGTVLQAAGRQLGRAGLVPVPQGYVALSFLRPAALPTHAARGSRIAFDFQLANDTRATITQPWQVTVISKAGSAVVVDRGAQRVPAQATATVGVSTAVPKDLTATAVDVALPGRHLAPLEFHVNSAARPLAP